MSEIRPIRTFLSNSELRVLLLASVVMGVSYSFVMPFMSLFGTRAAHMSPLGFGIFMTIVSLSGIVLSTWLARRSDVSRARKPILALGALSGAVGYIGYAFLRDPLWLTLCGAVFIGLSSVTFSQLFAYARDLLADHRTLPEQIPLYMNVFRSAFALAWTAGPAAAAWVMSYYSFTGTFLVAAACLLVFSLIVLRFLPEVSQARLVEGESPAFPIPSATASLTETLKAPRVLSSFAAFSLYFVASTMGMLNLPLLLVETIGQSEREVGIAYSVAPCFELPFMYYVGVLATRVRHDRIIVVTLGLAVAYYLGLSLVTSPVQVYGAQVLSALIVSVTGGVAITFFQDFLPGQTGTATNLYSSAQRLGSTVGYLAFGALSGSQGHRVVFVACAGLALISGVLLALAGPGNSRAAALRASPRESVEQARREEPPSL